MDDSEPLLLDHPEIPVVNLLQGFAHVDPSNARLQYLRRPAFRIRVSEQLRDAVAVAYVYEAVLKSVQAPLDMSPLQTAAFLEAGKTMVAAHTLDAERRAYRKMLTDAGSAGVGMILLVAKQNT